MQTKSMDGISGKSNSYEKHQRFAAWVYVLIAITCTFPAVTVLSPGTLAGGDAPRAITLASFVAFVLFLLDILALRTKVDSDAVRVTLGRPIPIFWKRIGIDSIRAARVVTYRPLLDAGGWGLRFGRFDGVFTIYWNARGNRGVLIETEKRRYIIGSQDPEALCAAIERVRGT